MYILVVEDERRLAQVVRKVLEEEGHTVDVAHDGEEGLAMAMDGSHDVVLLDVLLPGIDGFEVCRSLRDGRTIDLSPKEFALLEFLMRNQGRVVTRTQILDHVWGYDYSPDSNLVDVYVTYLRRKIDRGHDRNLIRTVRGAGYALGA